MDTKSKNSRPFAAWLCFFLALNIIGGLLFTGLAAINDAGGDLAGLKAPFTDYKNTRAFKQQTKQYFEELTSLAAASSSSEIGDKQTTQPSGDTSNAEIAQNNLDQQKMTQAVLNQEGANLKYYVRNQNTGLIFKNMEADLSSVPISGPDGYKYVWYYDGQKVSVWDHGKPVDIKRLDSGYAGIISNEYETGSASLSDTRVMLAVKDTLVKNSYGHSAYYQEQQILSVIGWVYIALGIAGIVLLICALRRRRDKRAFERKLASWSGSLWFEAKALFSLLLLILLTNLAFNVSGNNDPLYWVLMVSFISCCILFVLWWFYLMLLDLIANKKAFFTHNIVNSLVTRYRRYESNYSWQKGMLKRAYMLVAIEAVLALISVIFLVISVNSPSGFLLLIALLIAAAGIYLLYRYLKHYDQTLSDLGKLTDHIELIKSGDMKCRLELDAGADMYPAAQNLNAIQEGMNTAVTDMMKAERMKIDLITNVSHDLKTPLTSIISYVDLLSREEDLPEHVYDYIKILAQKSERLKNLIQDLFDLSKASSQNVTLDTETLDLARLIRQTLADMEEQINASGLSFRLAIPDETVCIQSDGKKLYRVWENLIANTLKYSLAGSRVFVDLTADEEGALAVIKNIANYEMNFGEDDILQRFVRGDEARSTEGSGLGLSIAQSFTQLCGGQFKVVIDGDLFKVELRFKTVTCSNQSDSQ